MNAFHPRPSALRQRMVTTVAAVGLVLGSSATQASIGVTIFQGICDASAVVPLGRHHQLIADDEDNILRLYDQRRGGRAVWAFDLSRFLRVDPIEPEVDIEAAARFGDRIFWISSHGRNRKGMERTSRHRFFATTVVERDGLPTVEPVGVPYTRLLSDLLADPRFAPMGLAAASLKPPKARDALSIEGLVALPDGRLLIGFRNPQPFGQALVVPLLNPDQVVAGQPARFGDPILLDLGQRGIRGLGLFREQVIIAAGAHDNTARSQLFTWNPYANTSPWPLSEAPLAGLNPESVEGLGQGDAEAVLLVSDDGSVRVGKVECKKLKDPNQKRFRAVVLQGRELAL